MPTMKWYRQARIAAWSTSLNWVSDTIVVTQHTSSYTPNLDTDAFVSNLTNEVANGNGYTQGGIALSGKTITYTPANSWTGQWAPATAYLLGQIVRPQSGNGQLFQCVVAGTSSASQPAWPAYGLDVTDGSVTWMAIGAGIVTWNAANIAWTGYAGTFRYLVVSDRQTGVASTSPLLGLLDMGTTTTGLGGNFDVNWTPAVFYDPVT
jgi:hypothetical protein